MTIKSSGPISLGADVNIELNHLSYSPISMGGAESRTLAGALTGPVKMSDYYGKSRSSGLREGYNGLIFNFNTNPEPYATMTTMRLTNSNGVVKGIFNNVVWTRVQESNTVTLAYSIAGGNVNDFPTTLTVHYTTNNVWRTTTLTKAGDHLSYTGPMVFTSTAETMAMRIVSDIFHVDTNVYDINMIKITSGSGTSLGYRSNGDAGVLNEGWREDLASGYTTDLVTRRDVNYHTIGIYGVTDQSYAVLYATPNKLPIPENTTFTMAYFSQDGGNYKIPVTVNSTRTSTDTSIFDSPMAKSIYGMVSTLTGKYLLMVSYL